MAKVKKAFFCRNCGYESAKWGGKCPSCGEWNTFVEETVQKEPAQPSFTPAGERNRPQPVRELQRQESTRTALGNAHDCCPIDGSGNGLEIGFNNKYMMDALKAAPQDIVTLELSSPITPCIIVPAEGEENFLFMVLPVRLKAES